MFKSRILFRILFVLSVFALTFFVPMFMSITVSIDTVFDSFTETRDMKSADVMDLERAVIEKLNNDVVVIAFYVFFIAFLMAIFFSRKIVLPIKMLFKGAESISRGEFDISLPVLSDDELGEVTRTFNRMARSIIDYTDELKKKDSYINSMIDPMWVLDTSDTILEINPAFTKVFGYRPDEVLGLSADEFMKEERSLLAGLPGGQEHEDEGLSMNRVTFTSKEGGEIPVLLTQTIIEKKGVVTGKIGIIKDITEITRLLHRLADSKKQLEDIMDSIDEEILLVDRDYRIVDANEKAYRIYGGDIIGKSCYHIGHTSQKPCWISGEDCPVQKVYLYGSPAKAVHEHIDSKGRKHYEEITASPIKDVNGKIIYVVELLRDITESKKYETMISQKNRELSTLNEISAVLNGSLNAEDIFKGVVEKLVTTFDMDGGGVYTLDQGNKILKCSYHKGVTEEFARDIGTVRVGEDIPGRVALTGDPITITDLSKDYRIDRSLLHSSGIKGYCCFPIKGKEKLLGVLCLFSLKEHYFREEDQRIITSVGEMCGLALENINLYESMRGLFGEQRRRRVNEQSMLLDLGSKISLSSERSQTIQSTTSLLKNHCNAAAAWYVHVGKEGILRTVYTEGMDLDQGTDVIGADENTMEKALLQSGAYILVEDMYVEKRFSFHPVLLKMNFRTAISLPIRGHDSIKGMLTLFYKNITKISEEDIHFMMIVAKLLAIAIDLSEIYERRVIEKSLSDAILDSIIEGVCTVDRDGFILSANSSVGKILGLEEGDLAGRNIYDIVPFLKIKNDDVQEETIIKRAYQGEQMVFEREYESGKGHRPILQVEASPLHDGVKEMHGVVLVIRDVSKEKIVERMKTELVRNVSHEFRTPLSALVGMAEMLMDGDVSGERAHEYLKTMYNEGKRLSRMVSDLLDLSRIEVERISLHLHDVSVKSILEHVLNKLEDRIEKHEAKVKSVIKKGAETIHADEKRMKQVMAILLTNALKYSDRGVQLSIVVTKERDFIIIEIRDTGWGIDEKELPRIGEKFYRGTYATRVKGTGLGIALCKEILRLHGGDLRIDSVVNEGTQVRLEIPVRE